MIYSSAAQEKDYWQYFISRPIVLKWDQNGEKYFKLFAESKNKKITLITDRPSAVLWVEPGVCYKIWVIAFNQNRLESAASNKLLVFK